MTFVLYHYIITNSKVMKLGEVTRIIMMHAMMNGSMMNSAMHGMRHSSMMHGMGWGGSLVYGVFMLLVFIVLILTIMALLKYLRND